MGRSPRTRALTGRSRHDAHPARADVVLTWTLLAVLGAYALPARAGFVVFPSEMSRTSRLVDRLAFAGHLRLDTVTTQHYEEQGLRRALLHAAAETPDDTDRARIQDVLADLRLIDGTYAAPADDSAERLAIDVYADSAWQADAKVPRRAGRLGLVTRLRARQGPVGFAMTTGWSLVGGADRYEYAPNEHAVRRSLSDVPQQVFLRPHGHVSIESERVSAQLGKFNVVWGPGQSATLFLSDNTDAKAGVRLQALLGPFRFESVTLATPHRGHTTHLSAHRLDITLSPRIVLSAYEGVMYRDRLELAYLNPISVYLYSAPAVVGDLGFPDTPGGGEDNTFVGVAGVVRLGDVGVFFDLLVDDLQVQLGRDVFKAWDSKFATQLGLHMWRPFGLRDWEARAEYTFANQYAYTHELDGLNHALAGRPLGFWLGPDADALWLEATRRLSARAELRIGLLRTRKGEQDVGTPHTADDPSTWEFLSGVVETTNELRATAVYERSGVNMLNAGVYIRRVRNAEHRAGEHGKEVGADVALRIRL